MNKILLKQGKVALVDDEDYEWLSQWRWHPKCLKGYWYAARSINPGTILMHRFILNPPKGYESDHINHNGLDNRRSNLRVATSSQNQGNRSIQKGTSQFKGVYWSKQNGKWRAQIQCNKNCIYLGLFDLENDAANVYNLAAIKYFGEFAKLNIIG